MTARVVGVGVAALGGVVGVLPFLRWYRVDVTGRDISVRGVDVRGELWSLPILACLVVAIGLYVAVRVPGPGTLAVRRFGGVCAVAGAMCLAWALWSVVRIPSVAVPLDVGDGPTAPLQAHPVALLAAAAGAAVAAISLWWVRDSSD